MELGRGPSEEPPHPTHHGRFESGATEETHPHDYRITRRGVRQMPAADPAGGQAADETTLAGLASPRMRAGGVIVTRLDPDQLIPRPAQWERILAVIGVVVLPTLNLAVLIVLVVLVAGT